MRAIGILGALAPLCLTASCTLIVGNVDFDGTNSTTSTGGTGGTTGSGGTSSSTSNTTGSGGHAGGTVCEPFTQKACYDADPSTLQGACHAGKQTCAKDGSGYGACTGQVTPAAEDDCVNKADTSCDGKLSCACTPKATEPCYDGTPGTEQHLPCKGGTRTCADDGSGWGGCAGQVTPKPVDDCTTQDDENCDGVVNDFCVCQTGQTQGCYTGKLGTEGVGLCHGGTQGCNSDGTGWAACNGEVKPQAEVCSAVGDEDCDGIACSEVVWSRMYATGDTGGAMTNIGFTVDQQGNSFLIVANGGGVDFGNGVSLSPTGNSSGLAKIGPDGKALWSMDSAFGRLAPDGQGNLYLVELNSWKVSSYDGSGNLRWTKTVATATSGSGSVFSAVYSPTFGLLIAGSYNGAVSFAGSSATLPNATGQDGFVARLDNAGTAMWAQRVTDASGQTASAQSVPAVALDPGGQVFLAGGFVKSVAIGSLSSVNVGVNDFYVAKLDKANGAPTWLKTFGSAGGDGVGGIAVDSAGNPLITGYAGSSVNFGGGTLTTHGKKDVFLLKLDTTGAHVWSKLMGSGEDDVGYSAAIDAADNLVLSGMTLGTPFGLGCATSGAGPGLFLGKIDPAGNCLWSKVFGPGGQEFVDARVRPGSNDIFLAGYSAGTIDLGNGPLTFPVWAYESAVLARFQP